MVISLVITVILILVASLGGLLFGASIIFDQSLNDPDVLVHPAISGNDMIITIYEGGRVTELAQISLEIEGYAPVVQNVPGGATEIVYVGIASQVTGTRAVGVRGIFTDGSMKILKIIDFKFT